MLQDLQVIFLSYRHIRRNNGGEHPAAGNGWDAGKDAFFPSPREHAPWVLAPPLPFLCWDGFFLFPKVLEHDLCFFRIAKACGLAF